MEIKIKVVLQQLEEVLGFHDFLGVWTSLKKGEKHYIGEQVVNKVKVLA